MQEWDEEPKSAQADASADAEKPLPKGHNTPDGWREELLPSSARGAPHLDAWKHAAAEALHGWRDHRFHFGKDLTLSRADYEAALKAATETKVVEGVSTYVPHPAALSDTLKNGGDR